MEDLLKQDCSFAVRSPLCALQQKDFSYVPAKSILSYLWICIFISKFCTVHVQDIRIALPNQISTLMLRFLPLDIAYNWYFQIVKLPLIMLRR